MASQTGKTGPSFVATLYVWGLNAVEARKNLARYLLLPFRIQEEKSIEDFWNLYIIGYLHAVVKEVFILQTVLWE